jgi:hypothetical protein
MSTLKSIIPAIIASIIPIACLAVSNRIHRADLVAVREQLSDVSTRLDNATAEIETLRDIAWKKEKSQIVYIERIDKGASEYAEKIREIETDGDACDWLGARLPDSVRARYTRADGPDCNRAPADDPADAMQQADAGNDGNE